MDSLALFTLVALMAQAAPAPDEPLFGSSKLIATSGVVQAEGSAGSGLVTWSVISGLGTDREIGGNVHATGIALDDFTFRAAGARVGLFDRVELSATRQWFDTGEAGNGLGLGEDFTFRQDIYGLKARLFGDAIYDQESWLPQVSAGVQYKRAARSGVLAAIGAARNDDVDFYLSASKIILSESLVVSVTGRLTRANQFGLLGFGGDLDDSRDLTVEAGLAYLVSRHFVVGADYRTKPDNLAFAEEDDAWAAYMVWLPNKHINVTAGYADLGDIALQGGQQGFYLSISTGF